MSAGTSKETIRFGILGCAKIAWKLARAMLSAEGVEIRAVGSRSLEKAETFCSTIKQLDPSCGAVAYGGYEEVLEDPAVDAVYIPLPTGLHLEWVIKSAEHGKHILLEKPVALSLEELDMMTSACDKHGVQIMDGTMWMHNPRAKAMEEILVDRDRFGLLKRISANFFFLGGEEFMESNIRVQKGLDELGCLGDIGWYCVRAALWAKDFELPQTVVASPGNVRNKHGVFISCGATLVWADGVVASFDCGFDAPLRQVLQLAGSKGTVTSTDFTIPHREDKSSFVFEQGGAIVDGGTRTQYTKEDVTLQLPKPQEALMVEALADIVRQIKAEGPPGVEFFWKDIMCKTMKVVLAVNDSAENGCAAVQL